MAGFSLAASSPRWLGQWRNSVARLNPDGTLDTTFNPGENSVYALALQDDSKILIGGPDVERFNAIEPATQSLAFDGSTITWMRGGSSPEVWRVSFDLTTNGVSWTNVGSGQRITGGWRLPGITYPANSGIRARGWISRSDESSGWFVESLATINPMIFVNGSFGFVSNQFGFNLNGLAGQTIVVEGSTNLVDWTALFTNTPGSNPSYFRNPETNSPRRFYRAVSP